MVLAIDVGTTTLKAAFIDSGGRVASSVKLSMELDGLLCSEASRWIDLICQASRTLCPQGGAQPGGDVDAIVVDGNGPTLVPWPDTKARLWLDRRAQEESAQASNAADFFIDSSFMIPKIMRLKRKERPVYDNARWFFGSQDYVNFILTGIPSTLMPLEGLEKWYWNDSLLEALELDKSKFPPFVRMGTEIGKLTGQMAKMMGLREGTSVIAGCPDFVTSILGTNTMEPGLICDRSGTSEGINLCSSLPSDDSRLMCYRHPNGVDYNISGIISTSGEAIAKAAEMFGFDSAQQLYDIASGSPAGSGNVVFNPYFAGERAPLWDSGARASFTGMTMSTGRADMARAVCEGVCLAIKDVIAALGASASQMRVTGGPSSSPFLNQLKADVTQMQVVTMDSPEPELLGLAMIAYAAIGEYPSLKAASNALVKTRRIFLPNPDLAGLYSEAYRKYKGLYQAMKTLPAT